MFCLHRSLQETQKDLEGVYGRGRTLAKEQVRHMYNCLLAKKMELLLESEADANKSEENVCKIAARAVSLRQGIKVRLCE